MREEFLRQPALFLGPELENHPAVHALDGIEAVIDWSRIEPLPPRRAKGKGGPAIRLSR